MLRLTEVGKSFGAVAAHHWTLGTGHRVAEVAAVADLIGLELRVVEL